MLSRYHALLSSLDQAEVIFKMFWHSRFILSWNEMKNFKWPVKICLLILIL